MSKQWNMKNAEYERIKKEVLSKKELTIEAVEEIVGIKAVVRRHEASMNKDMTYVYKTALNCLYQVLKLEGYSESHLNMVVYSENFEYKGIKY